MKYNRDALEAIMNKEQSGFQRVEMDSYNQMAGYENCFISGLRMDAEQLVILHVTSTLAHNSEGLLADEESQADAWAEHEQLLTAFDCRLLLLLFTVQEEWHVAFFSQSHAVRAIEFLDYMFPEYGLVKGGAAHATARISSAILQVKMSAEDISNALDYVVWRSGLYFSDCEVITAVSYGKAHADELKQLPRYVKQNVPWAYVKSTEIAAAGTTILVSSLENETGIEIVAGEEQYIMIGCRGEIYDIKRDKFESTYDVTNERLDVFERMMDYLPEVVTLPNREFVSIDELAYVCYPKRGVGIFARELEKRTKIFPAYGGGDYFLGRPGDMMAVRTDDVTDIYIIQGDIFRETYQMV
jgi:hypothetical protein